MAQTSKSKNSVPSDKHLNLPTPDQPILPMSRDRSKLKTQVSRSKLDLSRKTPPKLNVSGSDFRIQAIPAFERSATPEGMFNKPKCEDLPRQDMRQQIINEQSIRIETISSQNEKLQQQIASMSEYLNKVEQENNKLRDNNDKFYRENQSLYQQIDEMVADVEQIKQGLENKESESYKVQENNKKLAEDLNKSKHTVQDLQKELNHKFSFILELEQQMKEVKKLNHENEQLLIDKDAYIAQLELQLNEAHRLSIIESKQQQSQQFQQITTESVMESRRSSCIKESEIYYMAQIEQLSKEKEICEHKLIDLQSQVNGLQNKNMNVSKSSSSLPKDIQKLKKIIDTQRRQIESHQKTIMNQHYEIQNLQQLLYCSTEYDTSMVKQSYTSNEMDPAIMLHSQQSVQWHHIKDKENQDQLIYIKQNFQQPSDTFRNLCEDEERNEEQLN